MEYYQVEVKLFGTEKIVPLDKTRGSVKNSNIEAGAALTHFLCAVEIIIMMSCPNWHKHEGDTIFMSDFQLLPRL